MSQMILPGKLRVLLTSSIEQVVGDELAEPDVALGLKLTAL